LFFASIVSQSKTHQIFVVYLERNMQKHTTQAPPTQSFYRRYIEPNQRTLRALGALAFIIASWLAIVQTSHITLNFYALAALLLGTCISVLLIHGLSAGRDTISYVTKLKHYQPPDLALEIAKLTSYSKLWFRKQFQIVDGELEKLDDPFMRRGLQAIRDQEALDDTMNMLHWKISQQRDQDNKRISVMQSLSQQLPVFSILVALLVLLGGLQGELSLQGFSGIISEAILCVASALLLNQWLVKPLIMQCERIRDASTKRLQLIADGIALVHQQRTPSIVFDTLINCIQDTPIIRQKKPEHRSASVQALIQQSRKQPRRSNAA
jgi:chemotaxis protein MotA